MVSCTFTSTVFTSGLNSSKYLYITLFLIPWTIDSLWEIISNRPRPDSRTEQLDFDSTFFNFYNSNGYSIYSIVILAL